MEKLPIVQFSLHTGCLASNIGNKQTDNGFNFHLDMNCPADRAKMWE